MNNFQSVLAQRQKLLDQITQRQAEHDATKVALDEAQEALSKFDADVDARLAGVGDGASPPKKAKLTGKATVKKAKKKAVEKTATKKAVEKTATKKMTKADFIRLMPADTPAKKVVEEAAKSGLTVTENHVYNVRAIDRKAAKTGKKVGKKKVGKKKVGKKAKTVTKESRKNAAAGREAVAKGKRPHLRDAMIAVMGKKTMNAKAVVEELAKKKWLPDSSNHHQYVSFMLSSNQPNIFVRTSKRGYYKVSKAAQEAATNGNGQKSTNSKGKKGPQAQPVSQVDKDLQKHWGMDVSADPLKDAQDAAADNISV